MSVGSEDEVRARTERLRADGFTIASEPRRTGDGYFESIVLDPDGNRLEITAGEALSVFAGRGQPEDLVRRACELH